MNPLLIQLAIVFTVAAACCTRVLWGRKLRHRDLRRAQLERVRAYRVTS